MLKSPCHIIATMRAKQDYVLETNDRGKQQPKKVGMAPVQREGMEYEFTVMLDVDMGHIASASKDRTSLFDGQLFKITPDTGKTLMQWLDAGVDIPAPAFDLNAAIQWISEAKSADHAAARGAKALEKATTDEERSRINNAVENYKKAA